MRWWSALNGPTDWMHVLYKTYLFTFLFRPWSGNDICPISCKLYMCWIWPHFKSPILKLVIRAIESVLDFGQQGLHRSRWKLYSYVVSRPLYTRRLQPRYHNTPPFFSRPRANIWLVKRFVIRLVFQLLTSPDPYRTFWKWVFNVQRM